MTALVFFLAGAIVAAVANNFEVLLVGRSLQGIGGGGLIALTEIVVTDLVPLRLRGQWFGIISGMWALGSVSGPIIGGAFAENVNWVGLTYQSLLLHEFLLICIIALDLLDQLTLYRHRFRPDTSFSEACVQAFTLDHATPACRLARLLHLHRFDNIFPHSHHLGRSVLPLDLLAHLGPSLLGYRRPHNFCHLRRGRCCRAADPTANFQE